MAWSDGGIKPKGGSVTRRDFGLVASVLVLGLVGSKGKRAKTTATLCDAARSKSKTHLRGSKRMQHSNKCATMPTNSVPSSHHHLRTSSCRSAVSCASDKGRSLFEPCLRRTGFPQPVSLRKSSHCRSWRVGGQML